MDASQNQVVIIGPGRDHSMTSNRSVTARDFRPLSVVTAEVDLNIQVSSVPVRIDQRGRDVTVDLHVDHSCIPRIPPAHLDRGSGVEVGHALILASRARGGAAAWPTADASASERARARNAQLSSGVTRVERHRSRWVSGALRVWRTPSCHPALAGILCSVDGLERAKADLEHGNVRKARDRLKGLVVTRPHDTEVRGLLAEAYRRDRQWPEAGRWGYLMGPAATDLERRAFEKHSAFGWHPRITEARLRRLLRVNDLGAVADKFGRTLLRDLPDKRSTLRGNGPLTALIRFLAARRSKQVWR